MPDPLVNRLLNPFYLYIIISLSNINNKAECKATFKTFRISYLYDRPL
jgi:hypothetical protein